MVVYLDLMFLINLVIDAAILVATARVRQLRTRPWRIVAASLLGASYVVMMVVPSMSFLFTFAAKAFFSAGMLLLAFGYGGMRVFMRNAGAFYMISFAAAGGVFGLHYVLQTPGEVMNGILATRTGSVSHSVQIGLMTVVLLLVPSIWLVRVVVSGVKEKREMTQFVAKVCIQIEGRELQCDGLIDTGNHLYDPLTRTPVMVAEAGMWEDVFPESWLARIRQSEVDQLVAGMGEETFIWQDRLRLIPYRGVNRGTQFMLALKPDKVVIDHNGAQYVSERVLIGLDGGRLSAEGAYQAIVHPTLVQAVS